MKKFFKYSYWILIHLLACGALFLIATAVASKLNLTNDQGQKDLNSRYFNGLSEKYQKGWVKSEAEKEQLEDKLYKQILVLYQYAPKDAKRIQEVFSASKDLEIAVRMFEAVKYKLKKNKSFLNALKRISSSKSTTNLSVFEWSNYQVWEDFGNSVIKDKQAIDSVAKLTGVESRLIVTCLVGEQVRMFNSKRELFKKYVVPFNYLIMPKNLSFGVTGMKESTAKHIERNLKDKNTPYYLGEKYSAIFNDLDSTLAMQYDSLGNEQSLQVRRLLQSKNHFYSYLYTALLIKQVCTQWKNAGHDISKRPEIIATLYNLGFKKSIPKSNPEVGGSSFSIAEKEYTFGGICFEFYYSGELFDAFPISSEPVVF
ncbi:MAG: hypothetical protein ACK5B9_15720 [Flavobacteriia bacterium]